MHNAASAERPRPAWYDHYVPLNGVADELIGPDGRPRRAWLNFLHQLSAAEQSLAAVDRHLQDIGVSYRVHGEARERTWPLSRLPLLIEEEEWATIAAGVTQRARVIEALLADVYGEGRLVKDGVLPAALVAGSREFLRPMVGIEPPGGRWLHFYAVDLGRGPDGRWWVLSDRAQAPSGAGYALENRLVMSRALPTGYRRMNVRRLAPFFRTFRSTLADAADRSEPRICLLTPGPYSQTYFEQAYLARYLGFLLLEGDDLVVHDGLTHVRTIAGLKRADVIWRFVDSDYVDPIELNGQSRLGIPGLLSALRHGGTVVANMPGAGYAETRALMSVMPQIAGHLTGEDLALPNIATWWCGDPASRRRVLDNLSNMAISDAFGGRLPALNDQSQVLPADLSPAQRDALREAIEARGVDFVGQEVVQLSTTPIWAGDQLVPRPFVLRVFAAATPRGWEIMPGGFCRISAQPDARAISMREGVQSADVWVLSAKPVAPETLLPASEAIHIQRILGNIPSRAADNLFWYGRYLERAEATLRVVRCLCARAIDMDFVSGNVPATIAKLTRQLVAWGAVPEDLQDASTLVIARTALADENAYGSGLAGVRMARNAGSVIRERISVDASKLSRRLDELLSDLGDLSSETDVLDAADRALNILSALSGLGQENMNRNAGWRFLDVGRRIERAISTCRLARMFASDDATAEDLDVMLDLIDCQITYRSRYMTGIALAPVRDMAILDPYNPRSVGFQFMTINEHLATLPTLHLDGVPEEPQRLASRLATDLETTTAQELDNSMVLAFEQRIAGFAEVVASRYFLRRQKGVVGAGISSLA
ncbi:circularly permuted type 2 ATP-grasp protein [Pseudorhodoplanes sp.]|uniref:circularly permuted type 2 ATP-grasp protein n=1 Tax=Pseudorhodoplanes sp. TaxID=1934341 RepID=UPI002BA0B30F|nr:circularly permuted type 2 ATP-grasp protein [Pseudorhodoplanes sp.]HWV43318.1 circularly permuted type 2 ATP-grasp protein [Pseudorhodoplanes sp.]